MTHDEARATIRAVLTLTTLADMLDATGLVDRKALQNRVAYIRRRGVALPPLPAAKKGGGRKNGLSQAQWAELRAFAEDVREEIARQERIEQAKVNGDKLRAKTNGR